MDPRNMAMRRNDMTDYGFKESVSIDADEESAQRIKAVMQAGFTVHVDGVPLPQDATIPELVAALKASIAKDKESR